MDFEWNQLFFGRRGLQRLLCGGLVELVVNAMVDVKPGIVEREWRQLSDSMNP